MSSLDSSSSWPSGPEQFKIHSSIVSKLLALPKNGIKIVISRKKIFSSIFYYLDILQIWIICKCLPYYRNKTFGAWLGNYPYSYGDCNVIFLVSMILKTKLIYTVWTFQDFSVIQNLREINFGESRSSKNCCICSFRGSEFC